MYKYRDKSLERHLTKPMIRNNIDLLTGYEGNITFIVPKVPTIFRGNAEENSWYRSRGDN
jgi:hypothetical protein